MSMRRGIAADRLEIGVDLRLWDILAIVPEISEWGEKEVCTFMRAAYGRGLEDGMSTAPAARDAVLT